MAVDPPVMATAMDWVKIAGVASLGAVTGGIAAYAVAQGSKASGFGAAACVLAGAGVIWILHTMSGAASTREYWFYPVGLLVGALLVAAIISGPPPKSQ